MSTDQDCPADLVVGWHPQGFTTTEPFRAHRELVEAGYRQVPESTANRVAPGPAFPRATPRPDGAIRLYAKRGNLYWLIGVQEPGAHHRAAIAAWSAQEGCSHG